MGCIGFSMWSSARTPDALYERTAAEHAAFLNRLAVSLLRADPNPLSLKVKRKQAGWDIHYLAQLLGLPTH